MDIQNVAKLQIPEGEVRAIYDKSNRLLWGRTNYNVTYRGDTFQQTYSGKNLQPLFADATISGSQTAIAGNMIIRQMYAGYDGVLNISNGVLSGIPTSNTIWNMGMSGLQPDTQYTISIDYKVNLAQTGNFFVLSKFVTNRPAGESTGRVSRTFTTDSNGDFTNTGATGGLCYFYNYTNSFELLNIQLELGSTATDYEKFVGGTASPNPDYPQDIQLVTGTQTISITDGTNTQNFTVDLGSTELAKIGNYQDYIYKSGDDWYVHKTTGKAIFTGIESWTKSGVAEAYYTTLQNSPILPNANTTFSDIICDYFSLPPTPTYNSLVRAGGVGDGQSGMFALSVSSLVAFRYDSITSVADWKEWLSNHNTTVYYPLATPTDTQITDATLIPQLDAIHQWLTRYGYNATVSGNLPIVIDRTNL